MNKHTYEYEPGKITFIVTSHENPPIPVRHWDWTAWYDGEEELCHYGNGPTESAAIQNLKDNYDPGDPGTPYEPDYDVVTAAEQRELDWKIYRDLK